MAGRKAERQPWNRSTRLREAPTKAAQSGEGGAEVEPAALETSAGNASVDRSKCPSRQKAARAVVTPSSRPRRVVSNDGADEGEREQTRAMIERAVSVAFGTVLTDRSASFEPGDLNGDGDVTRFFDEDSGTNARQQQHDKENNQTQQRRFPDEPALPATRSSREPPEEELARAVDKQTALRCNASFRHEQHQQSNAQALDDARKTREFQRRLNAAAVEFHARQDALQSLYERVQREIRYLAATASDLDKRQLLLEDAFASYERALRAEFDQQNES